MTGAWEPIVTGPTLTCRVGCLGFMLELPYDPGGPEIVDNYPAGHRVLPALFGISESVLAVNTIVGILIPS